ncbi:MAG: MazG nucleotide pyrophosphohydrolase domain-containing protein [Acidimicrobiales bacterium]
MGTRVTVVGLGPAGPDLLTDAARRLLAGPGPVYLRTRRHPAAADFPDATAFDHHYETGGDFDTVYAAIVEDLVAAAARSEDAVVYGVPGSPLVAERTVELLRADPRVELTVVPSLSFLDVAWACLGIDPLAEGARLVDGTRFAEQAAGERGPLLVAQCWSTPVLSDIKLSLDVEPGPDEPLVTVLHHLGLPDEQVTTVRWHELDRAIRPDHLTSLWMPELAAPVGRELVALDELAHRLRRDCPWDREQTHASLARHLLEESYETLDAIDELSRAEGAGDVGGAAEGAAVAHLEEELGDLLFQVYIHSVLAAEKGRFTLADVARGIHDKLVARHPHVFGDTEARSAGAVESNWEALKKEEKGRQSVTDGIPLALPALALAAKLQRKAEAVPGFARSDLEGMQPLLEALAVPDALPDTGSTSDGSATEGQSARLVGAALWTIADLARRRGVDPEAALRTRALASRQEIRAAEGLQSP